MSEKKLYKLTVRNAEEYVFLDDAEFEKFIDHLVIKTKYHYLKIKGILNEKNKFIKRIRDPKIIEVIKKEKISGVPIYEVVMNTYPIKKIYINKKKMRRKARMGEDLTILKDEELEEIKNYLSIQYKKNIDHLYNTSYYKFYPDLDKTIESHFSASKRETLYNLNDLETIKKLPTIGFKCYEEEKYNNSIITSILKTINTYKCKKMKDILYPLVFKSFSHIKFINTPPFIEWLEKNKDKVKFEELIRIFSVNENLERLFKFKYPNFNRQTLDLDFVHKFIREKDCPLWGTNEKNLWLISPINRCPYRLNKTTGWGEKNPEKKYVNKLNNTTKFWEKFHKFTDNVLKTFIEATKGKTGYISDNFVKTKGNNSSTNIYRLYNLKYYICGGIMTYCLLENQPVEEYKNSDIDIVVYAETSHELDSWVKKVFMNLIATEVECKKIETKGPFNKWWIIRKDNGQKFEIFSSQRNIIDLISSFHLSCVRSFTDGKKVYLLPSCVETLLTGIGLSICWMNTKNRDIREVLRKYFRRGFSQILIKENKEKYIKYLEDCKENYIALPLKK
jgi:hypothetical protein